MQFAESTIEENNTRKVMRHLKMLALCIGIAALLAACSGAMPSPSAAPIVTPTAVVLQEIGRESLTIELGDFETEAELTYPAGAVGASPTVILLHGSAAADMDYTRYSGWGGEELLSHNFRDIAEYLAPRGYAVLRFNKHYVSGPTEVDWERYSANVTLQQLLTDAEQVLTVAKSDPHVDGEHIFILGWSEGSVVGAALAVHHPELAGLILQGPAALPFPEITKEQVLDVGIPYLRSLAADGLTTSDILEAAIDGPGGQVAKGIVAYLVDPEYWETGKVGVNAALDQNRDQAIALDQEFLPALDGLLDARFTTGDLAIYRPGRALPSVTEQAASLKLPILILQGENDANTPARGARLLEQALQSSDHPDHQLIVYAGLGHSLGRASSVIDDNFRPIEQQPLDDLIAWLAQLSD